MQKNVLGRGLSALIPEAIDQNSIKSESIVKIKLDSIKSNPYQPRKYFDETALQELSDSIKEHGVVEPVIVTKEADGFNLVVGERRLLASRLAGLNDIPAIIKDYAGADLLEVALIENIQRQDLNPLEEAEAYNYLLKEFGFTQEKIAKKMGKSRPAIANTLRLLSLPYIIREDILKKELSEGHARAILMLEDDSRKEEVWGTIKQRGLSVRQAEVLVKIINENKEKNTLYSDNTEVYPEGWEDVQDELTRIFSAKVGLAQKNKQSGKIEIGYSSREELERIVDLLLALKVNIKTNSINVALL